MQKWPHCSQQSTLRAVCSGSSQLPIWNVAGFRFTGLWRDTVPAWPDSNATRNRAIITINFVARIACCLVILRGSNFYFPFPRSICRIILLKHRLSTFFSRFSSITGGIEIIRNIIRGIFNSFHQRYTIECVLILNLSSLLSLHPDFRFHVSHSFEPILSFRIFP